MMILFEGDLVMKRVVQAVAGHSLEASSASAKADPKINASISSTSTRSNNNNSLPSHSANTAAGSDHDELVEILSNLRANPQSERSASECEAESVTRATQSFNMTSKITEAPSPDPALFPAAAEHSKIAKKLSNYSFSATI